MSKKSDKKLIMDDDKIRIRFAFTVSIGYVFIIWFIKIFELASKTDFISLGIYPRTMSGLKGIFLSPLIHADFSHLISNSVPLLVLLFFTFYLYTRSAVRVFLIIYFFHGLFVWFTGRPAYHIGASGLIYGFAGFLFLVGVLRKDAKSIAVSLVVVFLYGSLVWGVLPADPSVSFEAHLFGAIVGLICAFLFRKTDPLPPKYEWEEDEDKEDTSPESVELRLKENSEPVEWVDEDGNPVKL